MFGLVMVENKTRKLMSIYTVKQYRLTHVSLGYWQLVKLSAGKTTLSSSPSSSYKKIGPCSQKLTNMQRLELVAGGDGGGGGGDKNEFFICS